METGDSDTLASQHFIRANIRKDAARHTDIRPQLRPYDDLLCLYDAISITRHVHRSTLLTPT